jgi:PAS domain S-box-containing protein
VKTASIRTHLMILMSAVSVPLLLAVTLGIVVDLHQSGANAKQSVHTLTRTMVSNTGGKIARLRLTLQRLAHRPLILERDRAHCDGVLRDLQTLSPDAVNLFTTDAAGTVLCSARPAPHNMAGAPWFQRFLLTKQFSVGNPERDSVTHTLESVVSAPIADAQGQVVGAVHMAVGLLAFDPELPASLLPPDSRYGFFHVDGTLIWRNLDPERVIGTRPPAPAARRIVAVRNGQFESVGVDGVARYFSVLPMPQVGWLAWVGLPASAVYAEGRRRAIVASLIALTAVGGLFLLVFGMTRRITVPVAQLEAAARKIYNGDHSARAAPGGPSEIAAVARAFNAMLDQQQRSEARRAEIQSRLDAILASAPDPMLSLDAQGDIVWANLRAEQLFGYPQSELLGMSIGRGVPERAGVEAHGAGGPARAAERQVAARDGAVLRALTREQDELDVEISASACDTETGRLETLTLRDVSERVRTGLALEAARQAAEQALLHQRKMQDELVKAEKMAALGALVAGIAHEINTPVGVALSSATHLDAETVKAAALYHAGELTEEALADYFAMARQASELVSNNSRRAAELIHSFKRVAVDQTSGERRQFDLACYIDEVLQSLHPYLKRQQVAVAVACPAGMLVDSFPGALAQVLSNLVINSLVHGFDDGKRAGAIGLTARMAPEPPDWIELVYRDNGHGIPIELHERVFEPFFTTRRSKGGSGLGLYVAYNTVQQGLKGTLVLSRSAGPGVTFVIAFPRITPPPVSGA